MNSFLSSLFCCCCIILSAVSGYYYWKYFMNTEETEPDSFKNYYCNKELTYCLLANPSNVKPGPTSSTPSRWIKFHHSCTECIGTYYFTFSSEAMGDCILRLQLAKNAQDIDNALDILAKSIDVDKCMNTHKKNRPNSPCLFFSNAEATVDTLTIGNIYDTIRNSFIENIPSSVAKQDWLKKHAPSMERSVVGKADPFLVMFYYAMKELTDKDMKYFSQMIPSTQYVCPNKVKMSPCD